MAEKDDSRGQNASNTMGCSSFFVDTIKAMSESVGVSTLQDEAAKELAEDITFRLKVVVQDAVKFMEQAKRKKLHTEDVEHSFATKNMEPLYGIQSYEEFPFRFASGGGRELHFVEEKDQELQDLMSTPLPKMPLQPSLRTHWLAIEGQQPAIPENPPPLAKNQNRTDSGDASNKTSKGLRAKGSGPFTPNVGKPIKFVTQEQVFIKQLSTHPLSVEQQLYYKEITEACVGSDASRRTDALQSLTNDPGLYEMLPKLCTFISEGVRINVIHGNLALLIYLMRMVNGLLENPTLYLQKYLHELIPSVATCIVSRQLCIRPELDNHWALRDFASRLMFRICKGYHTPINNIQTRILKIFNQAITQERIYLSSMYGGISGFSEFGHDVIKAYVLPKVKELGMRLELVLEGVGQSQPDKISATKIKGQLMKILPPVIKTTRFAPDILDDYKAEYGYLGVSVHTAVLQLRSQDQKQNQAQAVASSVVPNKSANSSLPVSTNLSIR